MKAIAYRQYRMTDSKLATALGRIAQKMLEDAELFAQFGVTEQEIAEFERRIREFVEIPEDNYFVGGRMMATASKSAVRQALTEELRRNTLRVAVRFGKQSDEYNRVSVPTIVKLQDAEFLRVAYSVHAILTDIKGELAGVGLTDADLETISAMIEQFKSAMQSQLSAVNSRREAKQQKIAIGNELFAKASLYCSIGKRIFAGKSSGKYNGYMLYRGAGRKKQEEVESEPKEQGVTE